jgi:peptide/nickel transport system permease protein
MFDMTDTANDIRRTDAAPGSPQGTPGVGPRWAMPLRLLRRKRKRRRLPLGSLLFMAVLALCAAGAPWIAPHNPTQGTLSDQLRPPVWQDGGVSGHLLGTDLLGRDLLSGIIYGARVSLSLAFLCVGVAVTIGTLAGVVGAYFGRWYGAILMRLADVVLSLPAMLLALVYVGIDGASYRAVAIVVVFAFWPFFARQAYGETMRLKSQPFVDLARVAGVGSFGIIRKHILPNLLPSIVVVSTFQLGAVMILEASLSYLGAGIPPPTRSWGLMVAEGQSVIGSAWWVSIIPALAIFCTVLAANFVGDWARDALDPQRKRG